MARIHSLQVLALILVYYLQCASASAVLPPSLASRRLHYRGGAISKSTSNNNNKGNKHSSPAWVEGLKNSLASALAAGASKTLLAPLDTLKTMQQHYISTGKGALSLKQAFDLIVARQNGFWELYAGLGVAVVGSMPSVGLYFGVYSYCKRRILPYMDEKFDKSPLFQLLGIASSAAIGNTIASFSRVPYEVLKQQLQTGYYASTWGAIRDISSTQGLRGFFPMGGVGIQMLRDIPYAMVTLVCYEFLKLQFQDYKEKNPQQTALVDALTGAIAGGIGSYVTNPMDVLKTRLQTDASTQLYGGSIVECARATWMEGGPSAFLRGSVPRVLHKVPANGVFFLFYEFFRTVLQVESESESEKS